jgi:PAT family beta-lactamase induction signal transducer AmpG
MKRRRLTAMAGLGFASGLPFALTDSTLQQWMTDAHVDVTHIGYMSLIGLPYSLKLIFAPFLDRYVPPFFGRRRGWLMVMQAMLIISIASLAMVQPSRSLLMAAILATVVAFFSACQDIVSDAYRTDVLPPHERGPGAATFVSGYRVALLFTGALLLILVDNHLLSWRGAYFLSAMVMAIGLISTWIAPEPAHPGQAPPSLGEAVVLPFLDIFRRRRGWLILVFILLFRLPDSLAGKMTVPFLNALDYTKTDIALYRQFLGVAVAIVAALVGGWLVNKLGVKRSLLLFGALQALSNLGFWVLSHSAHGLDALIAVLVVENICAGLVTAGFIVFLMNQCRAEFSATQYALFTSLMAVAGTTLGSYTGALVEQIGYSSFFLVTAAVGLPALVLLPWLHTRKVNDESAPNLLADKQGGDMMDV